MDFELPKYKPGGFDPDNHTISLDAAFRTGLYKKLPTAWINVDLHERKTDGPDGPSSYYKDGVIYTFVACPSAPERRTCDFTLAPLWRKAFERGEGVLVAWKCPNVEGARCQPEQHIVEARLFKVAPES